MANLYKKNLSEKHCISKYFNLLVIKVEYLRRTVFSQVKAVLYAYKARTVIAVIGVLLGAMALVIVQNVSLSLKSKVDDEIKVMGDRVVTIFARTPQQAGMWRRSRERPKTMKMTDVEALKSVGNILEAAPIVRRNFAVKYMGVNVDANLVGTDNNFFFMRNYTLVYGSFFDKHALENLDKVAVLGSEIVADFFGERYAIGETIYIGTASFQVIGVLNSKGSDFMGNTLDNVVIVPLRTAQSRLLNQNYLSEIIFRIRKWKDFSTVEADVTRVLRLEHNLPPGKMNDFDIINPIDEQKTATTIITVAEILGSISAGVAFFIGTVGIFSLMLLIVAQRTVEIGIKRAIGATKSDILFQFLFESGFIGVLGGFSGIAAGCILSTIMCYFVELPYRFSFLGMFAGLVSSIFSGVAAGLYPAVKASRVTPVKALQT